MKNKKDEEFIKPDKVEAVTVDSFSGGLPVDGQPQRSEYFIKGTEATTKSAIYQRDFYVFKEDDPVSTDGKNRWQEGIDAWIEQNHKDDQKYHPPDDVKNISKDQPTETPTPQP